MKKLLSLNFFTYLMISGLIGFQVGCTSPDQNQTGSEAELAFNDFKEYVTSTETTATNQAAMTQADWDKASADAKATYDTKVTQLDQYEAEYDEGRQEEIADLKNRHNTYWQQREAEYKAQVSSGAAGSTVNTNVAADFQTTEVATTSPENIRLAYENLVNRVQINKDSYTRDDWKIINDYYLSLDERRDVVQNELSDKDKLEIAEAKAKYVALRTAARFDPDVSEAAADVKGAAVSAGQKVGDKAEKAGSEVKGAAKTGAEKVDNAVDKVGSEIKSTTKKVVKKIDSKIDNDPERN